MADSVLDRAIEIVVERDAKFLRSAKKRVADRWRIYRVGHSERAAIAMVCVKELLIVFAAFEIGQNFPIAPACRAGVARPSDNAAL